MQLGNLRKILLNLLLGTREALSVTLFNYSGVYSHLSAGVECLGMRIIIKLYNKKKD